MKKQLLPRYFCIGSLFFFFRSFISLFLFFFFFGGGGWILRKLQVPFQPKTEPQIWHFDRRHKHFFLGTSSQPSSTWGTWWTRHSQTGTQESSRGLNGLNLDEKRTGLGIPTLTWPGRKNRYGWVSIDWWIKILKTCWMTRCGQYVVTTLARCSLPLVPELLKKTTGFSWVLLSLTGSSAGPISFFILFFLFLSPSLFPFFLFISFFWTGQFLLNPTF